MGVLSNLLSQIVLNSRESNEVTTYTKAGTGSSSNCHTGEVSIEYREGSSGGQSNEKDLIEAERTLGDGISGNGDHKTLNKVLNGTSEEFAEIEEIL